MKTILRYIFPILFAFSAFAQVPIYTRPPTNSISGGPISGATITGSTIDSSVIGGTTPAAGTFTSMFATGGATPGATTSGVYTWQTGGGAALTTYIDSTRTANNRIVDWLWAAGQLTGRFQNDAYNSTVNWITITGGQAAGLTSISFGTKLLFDSDNASDIGASGATRPRTVYAGTSVISPAVNGLAASAGGTLALAGGAGSGTTGGNVTITGGTATSGAGSTVTVTAGSGAGGTNAGGDVNLVPGAAVSTGTPGEVKINSARGFFDACWQQYLPASVPVTGTSYTFFMANRAYRVVAASIINSSTSTVPTVDVTKDTGTTAPGAGSTVLTGVMTFSATANTRVTGTIIGTVATTNLAAGDRLATKWAGTVGAITGAMVCVTLVPI